MRAREIESDLPARLDRLPWSAWHTRLVVALGITWTLDGLEVTAVGAIASVLREPRALALTELQVGAAASAYLAGAIVGSLVFGRLSDQLGRKRLFLVTLGVYLGATLATALAWNGTSFALFRALTGAGIGGEYSAINSAIDELLPARVRGRADLALNGTYWLGTALGAAESLLFLNPHLLPTWLGWRLVFGLGAVLGAGVLLLRRHLPESARWLLLHGREAEALAVVQQIEAEVSRTAGPLPAPGPPVRLVAHGTVGFGHVARTLLVRYRRRTALGLSLMISQAFAYNAVFFTYALVLARFDGVPPDRVGLYLLPFALANLAGPLLLGHLFDAWGRRQMIALTYGAAGLSLGVTAVLFGEGLLGAASQTALWSVVFFFASPAASSAYLTVSELFPVELRGLSIALFYAAGTAVGGLTAPALFGALIERGSRWPLASGWLLG
ncbi:MAG: MFS transporter, partial [Deltaproteobacteria bacterium]